MKYIALFFTHSGAMKYKRFLAQNNISCNLMPVPRKLSSNCGIAAEFQADNCEDLITEDIEKVYLIESSDYILKYLEE